MYGKRSSLLNWRVKYTVAPSKNKGVDIKRRAKKSKRGKGKKKKSELSGCEATRKRKKVDDTGLEQL